MVRAAVTAFCSLTRPSRRDAAQLDDLVLPLLPSLAAGTRRYVAAALSDGPIAPRALVRRLAEESVEIAAPLLARSPALSEADLVGIASRQGKAHLAAILSRATLTEGARLCILDAAARSRLPDIAATPAASAPAARPKTPLAVAGENAESVRRRLRSMMSPAGEPALRRVQSLRDAGGHRPRVDWPTLRAAALTGAPALLQTALADALGIDFARARSLFGRQQGWFDMLAALRALSLTSEQAFVVVAAAYPDRFAHAEAIRLFLDRFELLHPDAARERTRAWKAESIAAAVARPAPREPRAVNDDGETVSLPAAKAG
ncbi:MAG: DUF2336 domain-containing protein [Rhizobiaceae bacterium]|nr:DUF2336 domain-containing protein [Rhizobiaceae bacterium]MCV0405512.1 DUF2336 domain-containing protein [Rhizobiaceae bacterium]